MRADPSDGRGAVETQAASDPLIEDEVAVQAPVGSGGKGRVRSSAGLRKEAAGTSATQEVLPKPRSRWGRLVTSAVFVGLVVVIAWLVWSRQGHPPALVLNKLDGLAMKAGEVRQVNIGVRRNGYVGDIRVSFQDLPPGIEIPDVTIPEDSDAAETKVKFLPDAPEGTVSVSAATKVSQGSVSPQNVSITVEPLCYRLPKVWHKAPGAKVVEIERQCYYDRIDVVKENIDVRFILISAGEREERLRELTGRVSVGTFYIMEDKVWLGLYKKFALANRRPMPVLDPGMPVNRDDEHPVMGVLFKDAHAFAVWLGGELPYPWQWDKAAGRFWKDRGDGPYRAPAGQKPVIAINRVDPMSGDLLGTMERGYARDDLSAFDVHDLAGNGEEWTRAEDVGDGKPIGGDVEHFKGMVMLRGSRWSEPRPYSFAALEERDIRKANTALEGHEEIGFRVVIEL
jgi:hypothetical protein